MNIKLTVQEKQAIKEAKKDHKAVKKAKSPGFLNSLEILVTKFSEANLPQWGSMIFNGTRIAS